MLLAASQTGGGGTYDDIFGEIPPESTEFGWPLYITIPFKEETEYGTFDYSKDSTEITQQLLQWCIDNNVEEGSVWMPEYYAYPPELYINGIKIIQMVTAGIDGSWEVFYSEWPEGYHVYGSLLLNDGSMNIVLRKES